MYSLNLALSKNHVNSRIAISLKIAVFKELVDLCCCDKEENCQIEKDSVFGFKGSLSVFSNCAPATTVKRAVAKIKMNEGWTLTKISDIYKAIN